MVNDKELIMLLFGIGTCLYIGISRDAVRTIPGWRLLVTGFFLTFSGWFFTIAEGFFFPRVFNCFEHIGYTGGALCMTVWCFQKVPHRNSEEHVH